MSGLLGIRMPDGSLITDPTWVTVSDVMACSHGLGLRRMPGELVSLDDDQAEEVA